MSWKSCWGKLILPWLVEKFSVFYITEMFITLCTKYVTLFQILILIDPVHTLPSYFIKMHCNTLLSPIHRSCKWSPSFLHASPQKPLLYTCHIFHPSRPLWYDDPTNTWWAVDIMKLHIMLFSPLSFHVLPLKPKYLLHAPFLSAFRLCFSFNVGDQVPSQYIQQCTKL